MLEKHRKSFDDLGTFPFESIGQLVDISNINILYREVPKSVHKIYRKMFDVTLNKNCTTKRIKNGRDNARKERKTHDYRNSTRVSSSDESRMRNIDPK
ncbi:hypothetical protein V1477_013045 [Vespula maculifrons]|uniref:Uncharacterized protein n=1 Tax=Vespula maculifrons TaxID=7453 RepID=A0ABD2BUU2_VESMC